MTVTVDLLTRLDRPLPRYTSYPTAVEWGDMSPADYTQALRQFDQKPDSLSLYVHIPFCRTMCLYCGCSVVLNRKPENEERYVDALIQEIKLVRSRLQRPHPTTQLHFGGGTPTQLSESQLDRLVRHLRTAFPWAEDAEIAIEIDPRTVVEDNGHKLCHLKTLGFNRVSFGVQDTDPKVQEAVRRRQSYEMTRITYERARELGFQGINIDLIYGLPYQTEETFRDTIEKILLLRPDRIALFSYAKVPWLKPHQKAMPDSILPSTQEKFAIYVLAREAFLKHGYIGLGMDHFALATDELASSYYAGNLSRNFQGYTVQRAENMLGLGLSAVGNCSAGYFQNCKELKDYYAALEVAELPVRRGLWLKEEDLLRRWVIHTLMCRFSLRKEHFSQRYGQDFDRYFSVEADAITSLVDQGLVINDSRELKATSTGQLFIRHVAAVFDAYLAKGFKRQFSKAV